MDQYITEWSQSCQDNLQQRHDRNISMTGNIVLPKSVMIGSDSGIQVLDAHDVDLFEIISNHWSNQSSIENKKEDSQCPTPCFKDSSTIKNHKKSFRSCLRKNSMRKMDFNNTHIHKEENKENMQWKQRTSKWKSNVNTMMKELNLTKLAPLLFIYLWILFYWF